MVEANAIEQRLERLHHQWDAFVGDREARVLRWLFRDDERRMLEAFLASEEHEDGELPALFLILDAPFEQPGRHGHELRRRLSERASEGASEFERIGLAPWRSPILEATSSDIGLFMEACASLRRHLADRLEWLVIVLWPSAIADPSAYAAWLRRAVRVVPDGVRVIVPDRAEAPRLDGLAEQAPERVRSVPADLDMPAAIDELARAAPGADEPGGRFRIAFVGMSKALAEGQLDRARALAEEAQTIAIAEQMPHLEVAVAFALGSGLIGAGRITDAVSELNRAEARAAELERAPEHDWAPGMRLRASMARASALVAAGAWPDAAKHWVAAAGQAKTIADGASELDCLRMAAWSHEQASDFDSAWAVGRSGLARAFELDAETRASSTLPWLGELLLRLSESGPRQDQRGRVVAELGDLLGSGWRARLRSGS